MLTVLYHLTSKNYKYLFLKSWTPMIPQILLLLQTNRSSLLQGTYSINNSINPPYLSPALGPNTYDHHFNNTLLYGQPTGNGVSPYRAYEPNNDQQAEKESNVNRLERVTNDTSNGMATNNSPEEYNNAPESHDEIKECESGFGRGITCLCQFFDKEGPGKKIMHEQSIPISVPNPLGDEHILFLCRKECDKVRSTR